MRVGVLPHALGFNDGGSHYQLVFLKALAEIAPRFKHEFAIMAAAEKLGTLASAGGLNYRGMPIRLSQKFVFQQEPPEAYLGLQPPPMPDVDPDAFFYEADTAKELRAAGIDLTLQLGPYANAFAWLIPFVMVIYDLNHRLQPEFPEVSIHGEFSRREYLYRNTCKYATLVLVDSQTGKEDVLNLYGDFIDDDRVRVLPYYPPIEHKPMPSAEECGGVRARYGLPPRYFFYPAQFWRHKNHELILRAIRHIADQTGEKTPIVFCGAYADYLRAANFNQVRALVGQLGLGDRAYYLGPVPDEDMPALYAMCTALVMPTFFGPTNLPPMEAWHYGRPVITSNIRGIREQTGDAGLLIDPRSHVDLANAMLKLWRDDALGAELAARGKKRLAGYSWDAFVGGVESVLAEACERVASGKTPKFPDAAI